MNPRILLSAIGLIACCILPARSFAQDNLGGGQKPALEIKGKGESGENGIKGKHRLMLELAHTHVAEGVNENGGKSWLVLPSWALNYDYWVSEKIGLGIHTDMILETFKVEENGSAETVERSRPIAPAAVILYKAGKHSTFLLGTGAEFASTGTLFLNRLGYEIGWELSEKWEVGGTLAYDIRWNAYDSWTFSFGVCRVFGKKRSGADNPR